MLSKHQRRCIKEAKQGNWKPADIMELAFLNDPENYHLQPHYPLLGGQQPGDNYPCDVEGDPDPKAIAIIRSDDGLNVVWRLHDGAEVTTDIDGLILGDEE